MSELIYLKRQNRILNVTTRTSLPDHNGRTYEDLALHGYLFGCDKRHTVPCSIKLKDFILWHREVPAPERLMIVASDPNERGERPFTTSYFWITLSNGGYGRIRISRSKAKEILEEEL